MSTEVCSRFAGVDMCHTAGPQHLSVRAWPGRLASAGVDRQSQHDRMTPLQRSVLYGFIVFLVITVIGCQVHAAVWIWAQP